MKVWITKYALTMGISERVARICSDINPDMISCGGLDLFHGEGREWHRTKEAATARAEEMRKAKIASLKKQIARLEKLTFQDRTG
jgi:hypothetical protein